MLDNLTRAFINRTIDYNISDPITTYKSRAAVLDSIGIESNQDTVISYISGIIMGSVMGITSKLNLDNETIELYIEETKKILQQRAWELREGFSKAGYT